MDGLLLPVGGFMCGLLAGLAAQYGRLCTIGAIEDALVAGDLRRTRAWALAAAVAMLLTQALVFSGQLDLAATHYVQSRLDRPVRSWLADLAVIDTAPFGGKTMTGIVAAYLGQPAAVLCAFGVPVGLLAFGLASERLHRRPRLVAASCAMGLAVAAGWLATGVLGDPFSGQRPESLTFVAPLARLILQIMGEALSSTGFAVATVLGVAAGSFAAAALREELRWEAFDDAREMRRHLLGAALMGVGGVLARGCPIGQGLTGSSTLSIAAPIAVLAMVAGARVGLSHLIEGRPLFARRR